MTVITQSEAHKEAIDKLRAWSKKKARVLINPIIGEDGAMELKRAKFTDDAINLHYGGRGHKGSQSLQITLDDPVRVSRGRIHFQSDGESGEIFVQSR